jgi:hypothetical protein
VQKRQNVLVTAGISAPADLTGQMAAGLVAGTMALHAHNRVSDLDMAGALATARRLYNVTVATRGVLKHDRALWRSDSFYDDRLWAVRMLPSWECFLQLMHDMHSRQPH